MMKPTSGYVESRRDAYGETELRLFVTVDCRDVPLTGWLDCQEANLAQYYASIAPESLWILSDAETLRRHFESGLGRYQATLRSVRGGLYGLVG